ADYFTPRGKLRLTWRPILSDILEWLEGVRASILEAAKEPLSRPFLSLVGADPECLDVPDFHPVCGFWSDNDLIGPFPWRARSWKAVIGPEQHLGHSPFPPQEVAASMPGTVWTNLL